MSSAGWQATRCHHHVAARAELERRLAHRPVLRLERPDDRRRRAGAGQPFALGAPGQALHLGGIAGHAHVLAVGELPAMQRVFLHGGDDEIAVRRKGDRGMGARPFELDRLAVGGREMQRHAIVAGDAEAHALRREGEPFDRARMLEFLHLAVGEADMGVAARSEGDRALRSSRDAGHPFAAEVGRAISTEPSVAIAATLPSSPPVIRRGIGGVERRRSAGPHAPAPSCGRGRAGGRCRRRARRTARRR